MKMKEFKVNEEGLERFCANQDDYGWCINIDEFFADPYEELEQKLEKERQHEIELEEYLKEIGMI